jgi:hypothetical protein
MFIGLKNNCSTPTAPFDALALLYPRSVCLEQADSVAAELARLHNLLDEALSRLGSAFSTPAHAAEAGRPGEARDVLLTTLQYREVCSQLPDHAESRLEASRTLIESDRLVHHNELNPPERPPVLQADSTRHAIELF